MVVWELGGHGLVCQKLFILKKIVVFEVRVYVGLSVGCVETDPVQSLGCLLEESWVQVWVVVVGVCMPL